MQIGVYLPDLTQLGQGWQSLGQQIEQPEHEDPAEIENSINTFS